MLPMKNQKGGALATVLMIAAIFLIVGMAVATITTHHLRISSSKGEAEKALLLAEAGVQQVIYTVEDFGDTSPLDLLSSEEKEKEKEKDLGALLTKAFDGGGPTCRIIAGKGMCRLHLTLQNLTIALTIFTLLNL